jgi:hypothetical protein
MSTNRLAAGIVAAALLSAGNAIACDCRTPNLADSTRRASVIVLATVTEFVPLKQVTVKPSEVFKGQAEKSITIPTGQSDCDYFLPPVSPGVGDEYLLFLVESNGRLVASRCFTTGPAAAKAAELRELRKR